MLLIDTCQLALFPTILFPQKLPDIIAKLNRSSFFDYESIKVEGFDDIAPPELVRLSISTSNDAVKLSFSRNKLSIYWENINDDPNFIISNEKVKECLDEIYPIFFKENIKIKRVGLISNLTKETEFPLNIIESDLLKPNSLGNLAGFQLKMNYVYNLACHTDCNLHLEVADANRKYRTRQDELKKVLYIQYDINTQVTSELNWGRGDVEIFLREVIPLHTKDNIYTALFVNAIN